MIKRIEYLCLKERIFMRIGIGYDSGKKEDIYDDITHY